MYPFTRVCALAISGGMFFGSPAKGDQNAMVTVIESPNWAKVPLSPLNREWTFFIGSTQEPGCWVLAGETTRSNVKQGTSGAGRKSDDMVVSF
jgi:hypothetical protein